MVVGAADRASKSMSPARIRPRATRAGTTRSAAAKNMSRFDRKYPSAPMSPAATKLPADWKR